MTNEHNDELYHSGRKGMKRGRNIFNPDYKPIGQVAGTGTTSTTTSTLQRQPVQAKKKRPKLSNLSETAKAMGLKNPTYSNKKYAEDQSRINRAVSINPNLKIRGANKQIERNKKEYKKAVLASNKEKAETIEKERSSKESNPLQKKAVSNPIKQKKQELSEKGKENQYENALDSYNKKLKNDRLKEQNRAKHAERRKETEDLILEKSKKEARDELLDYVKNGRERKEQEKQLTEKGNEQIRKNRIKARAHGIDDPNKHIKEEDFIKSLTSEELDYYKDELIAATYNKIPGFSAEVVTDPKDKKRKVKVTKKF